jgi:hypothetical protein
MSVFERPAGYRELYVYVFAKVTYGSRAPEGGEDLVVILVPKAFGSPGNEVVSPEAKKTEMIFGQMIEGTQKHKVTFGMNSTVSDGDMIRRELQIFSLFRDWVVAGPSTERVWLRLSPGNNVFLPDMIDSAKYTSTPLLSEALIRPKKLLLLIFGVTLGHLFSPTMPGAQD